MNKFCENCGNKLNEGVRFCANCGAPTNAAPAAPSPAPPQQSAYAPPPQQSAYAPPSQQSVYAPAPQQGYGAYANAGYAPPPKKRISNALCIALAALLFLQIVAIALFGWPGFAVPKDDETGAAQTLGRESGRNDTQTAPGSAKGVSIRQTENGAELTFNEDPAEALLGEMTAAAVNQYTYARVKMSAMIEHEFTSIDELTAMTAELTEAYRLCDVLCEEIDALAAEVDDSRAPSAAASRNMPDAARSGLLPVSYKAGQIAPMRMSYSSGAPRLMRLAAGGGGNAAKEWAEGVQKVFDSAPNNQRIKKVAEYLGTDVKRAKLQLDQALNMLESENWTDLAEVENNMVNTMKTIEAGAKVGVFVTGAIVTAGAPTLLGVGGVIVDGAEAAIYVAETGATIVAGENARITMDMQTLKDKFEPIAAVAGGVGFVAGVKNYMKAEKAAYALGREANNLARGVSSAGGDAASSGMKQVAAMAAERADRAAQAALNAAAEGVAAGLDFIGDDLAKYLNENDVLEIDIAPGATTATAVNIGGMTEVEAAGALMDAGILPPVESEAKTHAEIAEGMEEDGVLSEEELRKLLAQWTQEMIDLLEETAEVLDEIVEEIEKAETSGGPIPIENVAGVYDAEVTRNNEVDPRIYVFTINGNGQLEDGAGNEYQYDQSVGTATLSSLVIHFERKDDTIYISAIAANGSTLEGKKRPELPPGGIYMEELIGRYDLLHTDDDGTNETYTDITLNEDGTLLIWGMFSCEYDPITATATGDTHFTDATCVYKFTKENGVIHTTGEWYTEGTVYTTDSGHLAEQWDVNMFID